MTTTINRPNRDALDKGLNIYRDAMRPFILRGLKRVRGMTVEDAIQRALPYNSYQRFFTDLQRRGASLDSALDVNHFPHIVPHFWDVAFRHEFRNNRSIWNRLWIITEARNQVAHPGARDLDIDIAVDALFNIAYILRAINAHEEADAVQKIREDVIQPTQIPTPEPPPPPPVHRKPAPTAQGYGVYTDLLFRYSTIHKTTCHFWKNRKLDLNENENYWRGPYDTVQQAEANPDTRGNVRRGGCCKP